MSALASLRDDILLVAEREFPRTPTDPYALAAAGTRRRGAAGTLEADAALASLLADDARDFPARMQLLVEQAGGTTALASCCGVTARTVRNWCQGHSDISRERCLILARAMRISPLWLISGEGRMREAENLPPIEASLGVDPERLAIALQVLQSYVQLVGGSLSTAQRAEAIVEIYGLLTQPGPVDAARLVAFHKSLAACLRSNAQALIA